MFGINIAVLLICLPLFVIGCGLCCSDSDDRDEAKEVERDKKVIENDTQITQNDKIIQQVVNQKNKQNDSKDYVLSREGNNDIDKGHGFQNLSNTCYMNAIMQCLLHTKGYTEWVKSKGWEENLEEHKDQNNNNIHVGINNLKNENRNNSNLNSQLEGLKAQQAINYQVKQLISQYGEKDGSTLSCDELVRAAEPYIQSLFRGYSRPIDVASNTVNIAGEVPMTPQKNIWQRILGWFLGFFSGPQVKEKTFGKQYDGTEFLFDFLNISCYGEAYTGFRWTSMEDCIKECPSCKLKSQYPGYQLSENIVQLYLLQDETPYCSLEGLLKKRFSEVEKSSGVDCNFCSKHRVATVDKNYSMDITGNKYLIFSFARYASDRHSNRQSYIGKKVIFPQVLDLEDFVLEFSKRYAKYSLYAVVYHDGDLNSGHYVAACKHDGNWILYNDRQAGVIERFWTFNNTSIPSSLSGDGNEIFQISNVEDIDNQNPFYISKKAYILFYEKLEQDD